MARDLGTKTYPARTEQVIVRLSCSFCGREAPQPEHGDYLDQEGVWADHDGRINGVVIERKIGRRWPEGGDYEATGFDCCPGCWDTKVVPVLAGLAVSPPYTRERDW